MGFSLGSIGKAVGGVPGAIQLGLGALGAFQQSKSSKDAARTQSQAGQDALALQRQVYDQSRADLAPYVQSGGGAMSTLNRLMTPGYETPDYGANYGGPVGPQVAAGGPTLASPGATPAQAPMLAPVPTRDTSEAELNMWNQNLRQSDVYLNFLRARGIDPNGKIKLTDAQQANLEAELAAAGQAVPSGMHIDSAGNLNQKNMLLKNIGKGALIGGAALTGLGAFGVGPLAGVLGGSGAIGGSSLAAAPGLGSTAPGVIMGAGLPAATAAGTTAGGIGLGTIGSLAGLGQQGLGLVQQARALQQQPELMMLPDGMVYQVPAEHVQYYLGLGGRLA